MLILGVAGAVPAYRQIYASLPVNAQTELPLPALKETVPKQIPSSANISMVFYSQAPFGNWNYPWQEACEEASILLVANTYFNHNWSRKEFSVQILNIIKWEMKTFGKYKDTNVDEINQMLNEYLGLKTVIHENPSLDDIKNILNNGHIIVATFAGKELRNPYFTKGGPIYHAIIIKGYKGDSIISDDVGTKNGADFVYSWDTIKNALHDFAIPIQNGKKRIIEVLPPT